MFATATTGISSVQLGGLTVHSFAGIGHTSAPDDTLLMRALNNSNAVNQILICKVLIIDEISMVSVRLFELLSKLFQTVRCNNVPFGGIQLISVDAKYCFLSETWTKIFPLSHCFILIKIFRQSDPEFLKILEEIKFASISEETKTKLRELCRPLQVLEGECSLRLNPRVMESFIFNREKLHENVSANDLSHKSY